MDRPYIDHPVFEQLTKYSNFYDLLSGSVAGFSTMGTNSFLNIDSYVFESMRETICSIKDILYRRRINDSYALLRKYYDAIKINIYTILYLDDNFSIDNFIVEKINNWLNGTEQIPSIRTINDYIQKYAKLNNINVLLAKDNRYSKIRNRCNDHTHYNFYRNIQLNNSQIYIANRIDYLNEFSKDIEDIFVMHLSYLFSAREHYMMSSYYIDCLECGVSPEENSQYFVAPFVQEIFDNTIKVHRKDIAEEIMNSTSMMLK